MNDSKLKEIRKTFTAKNILLNAIAITNDFDLYSFFNQFESLSKGRIDFRLSHITNEDNDNLEFALHIGPKVMHNLNEYGYLNKLLETLDEWANELARRSQEEVNVSLEYEGNVFSKVIISISPNFDFGNTFGPTRSIYQLREDIGIFDSFLKAYVLINNFKDYNWDTVCNRGFLGVNSDFESFAIKMFEKDNPTSIGIARAVASYFANLALDKSRDNLSDNVYQLVAKQRKSETNELIYKAIEKELKVYKFSISNELISLSTKYLPDESLVDVLVYLCLENSDYEEGYLDLEIESIFAGYESAEQYLNHLLEQNNYSQRVIDRMDIDEKIRARNVPAPSEVQQTSSVVEDVENSEDDYLKRLIEYIAELKIPNLSKTLLERYCIKRVLVLALTLRVEEVPLFMLRHESFMKTCLQNYSISGEVNNFDSVEEGSEDVSHLAKLYPLYLQQTELEFKTRGIDSINPSDADSLLSEMGFSSKWIEISKESTKNKIFEFCKIPYVIDSNIPEWSASLDNESKIIDYLLSLDIPNLDKDVLEQQPLTSLVSMALFFGNQNIPEELARNSLFVQTAIYLNLNFEEIGELKLHLKECSMETLVSTETLDDFFNRCDFEEEYEDYLFNRERYMELSLSDINKIKHHASKQLFYSGSRIRPDENKLITKADYMEDLEETCRYKNIFLFKDHALSLLNLAEFPSSFIEDIDIRSIQNLFNKASIRVLVQDVLSTEFLYPEKLESTFSESVTNEFKEEVEPSVESVTVMRLSLLRNKSVLVEQLALLDDDQVKDIYNNFKPLIMK